MLAAGRPARPSLGRADVLRNALAVEVARRERALRLGVALLGGERVPFDRLFQLAAGGTGKAAQTVLSAPHPHVCIMDW